MVSDIIDFEGTKTPGNRILNQLRHFIKFLPYTVFRKECPLY